MAAIAPAGTARPRGPIPGSETALAATTGCVEPVTGAGRVFSAGQDLDEMTALATGTAPEGAEHGFRSLLAAVEAFDKPLLAAVNGPGVGIGFTLLLHCDLVWMAESARLRVPFAEMAGSTLNRPGLLVVTVNVSAWPASSAGPALIEVAQPGTVR